MIIKNLEDYIMSIKLLKQKNFLLLLIGKLISLLGSNMLQFALSLYVLKITGSATVFASILSIIIIPRLIFSPFGGVMGDWFDRKKSIIFWDTLNFIFIGSLSIIFALQGNLKLSLIYTLVIFLEIVEIFFHSSISAVLPSIVSKDDLLEANATNSIVLNIGNLLAPLLAAALYGTFGMGTILAITSISFMLSAVTKMFINIPKSNKMPEKISLSAFKDDFLGGIRLIKDNKLFTTIVIVGGVLNFSIAPVAQIGITFISKEILKVTDFQFGLFQTIMSTSMILAPLIGGKYVKKMRIGKLLFTSFLAIGFTVLSMSLIPLKSSMNVIIPYVLLLIGSFIIGMSATFANISLGTLFSQIVPLELMGRASTIMSMAMTILIPIGQMLFGYLYDRIEANYVFVIAGVILLVDIFVHKKSLLEYGLEIPKKAEKGAEIDENQVLPEVE